MVKREEETHRMEKRKGEGRVKSVVRKSVLIVGK